MRTALRHDGLPAKWCDDCASPHDAARRLSVLRRMLPATSADIQLAHAHLWPGEPGRRQLVRDLRALGAVSTKPVGGVWRLP